MRESVESWERERDTLISQRNKIWAQLSIVSKWLELYEDGIDFCLYFKTRGCDRIAIYGAAEQGRLLLKETRKENSIEVSYFLDKNAELERERWGKPVYLPEEYHTLPEVDMVVVTTVNVFTAISENLLQIRMGIPVVSLDTIIREIRNEV